jgi:hypothetical protein
VDCPSTGTEHQMADAETDAKPVDQDALVADIDRTRLRSWRAPSTPSPTG